MHRTEGWLQIRISETQRWSDFAPVNVRPTRHIDDNDEFRLGICDPAITGEALVDSLEEPKVLIDGFVVRTNLKDV